MYNLISLGALQGEEFNFNSKSDLVEVSKEAHIKFQAERADNVYMLLNSKLIVGGLQLSLTSKAGVVEQSETTIVSNSDVQLYPEKRLRLYALR